jgi:hypothetical protein
VSGEYGRELFEREQAAYRARGLKPPGSGPRERPPVDPHPRPIEEILAEELERDERAKAELAARLPRHETITGGLLTDPL